MSTLADRVNEVIESAGLDTASTAKLCSVSYQAIRKLRLGESESMEGKTLLLLARHTGFEAEWILFGTGPKHRAYAKNKPQTEALEAMEKMTEYEQRNIPDVVVMFSRTRIPPLTKT